MPKPKFRISKNNQDKFLVERTTNIWPFTFVLYLKETMNQPFGNTSYAWKSDQNAASKFDSEVDAEDAWMFAKKYFTENDPDRKLSPVIHVKDLA